MSWLDVFQHWFYTAFFVLMAWAFLKNPARYTSTCAYFAGMKTKDAAYARIMNASIRRMQLENISPRLGYYLGALSTVLAVLCGATWLQPSLWYAILALGMSMIIGNAYLQLRNSQKRRVAVLAVRAPGKALSPYWVAAALLAAFTPLADLSRTDLRFTIVAVVIASLIMTAVAWRIAEMPAMLEGVDVPAEQFVDDSLRSARSMILLVAAMAVPFVYLAQTSVLVNRPLHTLTQLLTFCVWFPYFWLAMRKNRCAQVPEELSNSPSQASWSSEKPHHAF